MTDTQQALLAGIIESPQDDAPRLIYADYLEENGQEERAEYIRYCVAVDRIDREHQAAAILYNGFKNGDNIALDQVDWELVEPSLHKYIFYLNQIHKLKSNYFSSWLVSDNLLNLGLVWKGGKRGFAESATISAPLKSARNANRILVRTPLTTVEFGSRVTAYHIATIVNSGLLNRVETIRNFLNGVSVLNLLADTPAVKSLQECENIPIHELEALVELTQFQSMKKLDLQYRTIPQELFQRMILAPHLKSVQEMSFHSDCWHPELITDFIRQDWSNLRVLNLNGCGIDDQQIERLTQCQSLIHLHTLLLDDNRITGTGFSNILASNTFQNIRYLSIDNNQISGISKEACANSKMRLWMFSASQCHFLQSDLKNLAQSDLFRELIWLSLGNCSITDSGLKNLISAPFERLTVLNLMSNRFVNSGVKTFAESQKFKTLQRCHLVNNEIDDVAASSLAKSETLRGLKHLCLSCGGLDHAIQQSLERHYGQAINLL